MADKNQYLQEAIRELNKVWPDNRTYHIVCHGHSIPCGYTAAHVVRPFDAYPHLLHHMLNDRFPTAVINVITTAIGGENSASGAKRFHDEVLSHRPDLITIDYGRNDMYLDLKTVEVSLRSMIEAGLKYGAKIVLITPAPDCGKAYYNVRTSSDEQISELIRSLAAEYELGLVDAAKLFARKLSQGQPLSSYLVSVNHLTREGHSLIAEALADWFPYV